jgi:alpha-mannosidase
MREVIAEGERMNEFIVFEDYPNRFDAWEIEEYMETKPYVLEGACQISPIIDGERAGFEIVIPYKSSTIGEKVWFYSKTARIDLEFDIDWQEKMNTLKLSFPTAIKSDKATCDIQFGHIERPTHRNTSWDMAKFEICAHKWIDVSEYGYGFSILSDSKYGYSVEGGRIRLTCLKCPTFPNPAADIGHHEFKYALLPHVGDFRGAGVIREAHSFNRPMSAIEITARDGELPESFSLIGVDEPSLVAETVKPAEDGRGIIVRLYESFGGTARARLAVPDAFKKATLTNLIERDIKKLDIINGEINIIAHPFEIITLRLEG